MDSTTPQTDAAGHLYRYGIPAGIAALTEGVCWLLHGQGMASLALAIRGIGWATAYLLVLWWMLVAVQPRATVWLGMYIAVIVLAGGLGMAADRWVDPRAGLMIFSVGLATSVVIIHRAYRTRPNRRRVPVFVTLTAACTALVCAMLWLGFRAAAIATIGVGVMLLGMVVGIAALRLLLEPTNPIASVARSVIDEAVRQRLGLVLVLAPVLLLPIMPLVLDPAERLSYRIQFFLSWSLSATAFLLSLLTIFLACSTVSREIERKWIHVTLIKPIERWQYLLGKFVGIVLLNGLMLSMAATGTYVFVKAMKNTPAIDAEDRQMVDTQILIARTGIAATPPNPQAFEVSIRQTIEQMVKDDPARYPNGMSPRGQREVSKQAVMQWCQLSVGESQTYRFADLQQTNTNDLQLRIEPRAGNIVAMRTEVRLFFWVNDRPWPVTNGEHQPHDLMSDMVHILPVSAELVEDGRIDLRIQNQSVMQPGEAAAASVSFGSGSGLEMLYQSGNFEWNYIKSILLLLTRLVFVAAIGLVAGSMLSFHVATLLTMIIFMAAVGSEWLDQATNYYTGNDWAGKTAVDEVTSRFGFLFEELSSMNFGEAVGIAVSMLTDALLLILPSLGRLNPVPLLSAGRNVSGALVAEGVLVVGVCWSLVVWSVGAFLFERRELARTTV
jgi:hypothetical protein